VAGADASPHLVVAAILASVLHGLTHHLKPTAPAVGRVLAGPDPDLPNGLLAALERLEHSSLLSSYIPTKFLQLFAELKRKNTPRLSMSSSSANWIFICDRLQCYRCNVPVIPMVRGRNV